MKPLINFLDYQQRLAKEQHRHNAAVDRLAKAKLEMQERCQHNHTQPITEEPDSFRPQCTRCGRVL